MINVLEYLLTQALNLIILNVISNNVKFGGLLVALPWMYV